CKGNGEKESKVSTCVSGMANVKRNDRDKFRLFGDSMTSEPSKVTNLPAFSVRPLPRGNMYEPYASCRSKFGVFRKENWSSSPRKIPSAWFFCESFEVPGMPAVRTRP